MQSRMLASVVCVTLVVFAALCSGMSSSYALAAQVEATTELELTTSTTVQATERPEGLCDVCRYVMENKQRRQPYLCRGLKDPNYQKHCVRVMESLLWWNSNQVYWVNYGCERSNGGAKEWVRPCPAMAICSWIQDFEIKDTFCPADTAYPKPE